MTENEKARELIATSETTVKVDPQNGWYLKRFAALQFEGSVDNRPRREVPQRRYLSEQ